MQIAQGASTASDARLRLAEFARLRTLWSATPEGQGGRAALQGFDYQISKALLALVRAELSGGGLALMEALSDIVTEDNGLVVAQLKLTLSSGAMSKSLAELWAIERLARAETPALREHLRYEVQASRRILQDDRRSLAGWSPPNCDAAELAEFKRRVTVEVSSAPRLEAARLLVEHYRVAHPFELLDQFAGRLLGATDAAAMDAAGDEFRVRLQALSRTLAERPAYFGVWGAEDSPPQSVDYEPNLEAAVRTGQRLRRSDLRAGRLADRSIYATIQSAAEAWIEEQSDSTDRLPTFWIEGRSGAGKSAALLYLMARLHAEDPERVILWLGAEAERLESALAWAAPLVLEGRQLILAIDDPLSPDRQARFQQAATRAAEWWERTRLAAAGGFRPPVLFCCGPTEQREFAEDECAGELSIQPHALPFESPEDLAELAAWYRVRTGREAPDLEGDVLLVQRFFEWNVGDLREFAVRFRSRLRALGGDPLFEIVARILAFGRIYTDYPAEVLNATIAGDPGLERSFAQLAETEAHLSFRPEEDGAGGVRLTHPHLADAIYKVWFGRDADRAARRRHLRDGLEACLHRSDVDPSSRFAPLWAVARIVRAVDSRGRPVSTELRDRVSFVERELGEVLPELYLGFAASASPLTDLPVWVLLDSEMKLGLSPSPARILRDRVSAAFEPAQGLRLSCHMLLAYGPPEGVTVVAGLLNRLIGWRRPDEDLPWHDWALVAADLIERGHDAAVGAALEQLVEGAPHWHKLASPILAYVRRAPLPDALRIGHEWLQAAPVSAPLWPWIVRSLRERDSGFMDFESFRRFLISQKDHHLWGTLWCDLRGAAGADGDELDRIGLAWIGLTEEEDVRPALSKSRSFGRVWRELFMTATGELRRQLRDFALAWLDRADPHHDGWSHVFSALWRSDDLPARARTVLARRAGTWLQEAKDNYGWSFVFHALVETTPHDPGVDLAAAGAAWLRTVEGSHSGFVYVLETVLKLLDPASSVRREIIQVATDWLEDQRNSNGWAVVWQILVHEDGAPLNELVEAGVAWLQATAPAHASWRSVFQGAFVRLPETDPRRADLAHKTMEWLLVHSVDEGWPRMFSLAIGALPAGEAAHAWPMALAHLETNLGSPGWPRLLSDAWTHYAEDPDVLSRLRAVGWRWLPGRTTHARWPTVWRHLAAAPPEAEAARLLELAEMWLNEGELDRPAWVFLWLGWRQLLSDLGRTEDLPRCYRLGAAWLAQAPLAHKSWYSVWFLLQHDKPDLLGGETFAAVQREWLRQPIGTLQAWSHVLGRQHRREPDIEADAVLRARALEWLAAADVTVARWSTVWHFALKATEESPNIARLADAWLKHNLTHRSWLFVWKRRSFLAGRAKEPRRELFELAETWMQQTPQPADWIEGWQRWDRARRQRPSSGMGRAQARWLAAHPAHALAGAVLAATLDAGARASDLDPALLLQGLRATPVNSPVWTFLWGGLMEATAPRDAELADLALPWLAAQPPDHRAWAWVWCGLWTSWPAARPTLAVLGHDWLRAAPKTAPQRGRLRSLLFEGKPRRKKRDVRP